MALKYIIKALKILPRKIKLDSVMVEIKRMLEQEMDYAQELEYLKLYQNKLEAIDGVRCVAPVERYCQENILATYFEDAYSIEYACQQSDFDSAARNKLGGSLLEIYYYEIFKWGLIQTDAHFGNYLISKDYQEIIMLDFGATKKLDEVIRLNYAKLIQSCISGSEQQFFQAAKDFGYTFNHDQQQAFWQYAQMIRAPHLSEYYDWGASNLDLKAIELIPKLMGYFPAGEVIGDTIFVDRKLMGLYYLLKKLKANIKVDELYLATLEKIKG
jgi:predicted unusual protein kinase regulating ubiquinone biosynthesis (AarF/ABC1/UbiB family)